MVKDIKRGKSPRYAYKSKIKVFAQKCNTKQGNVDTSLAKFLDESAFSKYDENEILRINDVIINSTGTGTLGRVNILNSTAISVDDIIVPDSHVTTVRLSEEVYAPFMVICIRDYQAYFEEKAEGSTNQKELKPDVIRNILLPIPPLREQRRIVSKIETLLPLCKQL